MKKLLIDYAEVISRPFPDTAMTELAQRAAMSASDFRQRYWNTESLMIADSRLATTGRRYSAQITSSVMRNLPPLFASM